MLEGVSSVPAALLGELRSAFRRLLRAPGFSILCLLTLAVGIGATTAIFSVVNGVLLEPLPYLDADRLVGVWHRAPGLDMDRAPQSPGTYLWYREQTDILESFALYAETRLNLTTEDSTERLSAAAVTPSLFTVLRTQPVHGRVFATEEGLPGGPPVVMLSHGLWQRSFGGDISVLGRMLQINGLPREVLGILPPGFAFPRPETELWVPMPIDRTQAPLARFISLGVGRLVAGISPPTAELRLASRMTHLEDLFPQDRAAPVLARAGFAPWVQPLREEIVGDIGRTLWVLLAAVGFLLLIACANVANLLLVRSETQRLESALRTALGASRWRNLLASIAESQLLAIGGGILGLLLALAGTRLLHALRPSTLPRLEEIRVDGTVLAAATAVALLCGLLVGLWPAVRSHRVEPGAILGGGAAALGLRVRSWGRRLLVGVQIALALVLLVGSGLMLRSFLVLSSLDPGFSPEGVSTFQLALPSSLYPEDATAAALYHQLLDRLRALPGVEYVGGTSSLPLGGSLEGLGHAVEDFPLEEGVPPPVFEVERVSGEYFSALGIPLLAGRPLDRADAEGRAGVVVINQTIAQRFWPEGGAIGRRLRPSQGRGDDPWYTVVGVVGDVRNRRLTEEPRGIVYYPLLGKNPGDWVVHELSLVVRSSAAMDTVLPAARKEIRSLDPSLAIAEARTLDAVLARARGRMRFALQMLGLATAAALLLAVVGTYGFVAYLTRQRRLEFGVRMSLGAERRDIMRLVLSESLKIALGGVVLGIVVATWLAGWLRGLLYEVEPTDPRIFAAVALLLVVAALVASALPARWAGRLDPITVLRQK